MEIINERIQNFSWLRDGQMFRFLSYYGTEYEIEAKLRLSLRYNFTLNLPVMVVSSEGRF